MDIEEQYDRLYRYCYMKVKHRQAAEDITQETFLRFLEAHSYREAGKQMAYLYTIARNLCMDYFRMQRFFPLEEHAETAKASSNEGNQLTDTIALEQALEQLSDEERELLFLRYTNEVSVGQISRILKLSRFAVYRRTQNALHKLKEILVQEPP